MAVSATGKNIGISPKKLKPVVDLVRGKKVEEALTVLHFLPSPGAKEVAKVVKSAASNAENNQLMEMEDLRIVRIYADEGPRTKRIRARARGRAAIITRRSSHVTVVVEEGS